MNLIQREIQGKVFAIRARVARFPLLLVIASLTVFACGLSETLNSLDDDNSRVQRSDSEGSGTEIQTKETLPTPTGQPTSSLVPDSGWEVLHAGLERRVINLVGQENLLAESLYLLRLDPAFYRFDVAYSPGDPKSLAQWQLETGALIVVNGGYFTDAHTATGLIISDGQRNGISYQGFGGMFAVTATGPEIRWLAAQAYDPDEPLLAALQSFPMLILPGGRAGDGDQNELRARRTVIAQDRQGRVLFILAMVGDFTLEGIGKYLAQSDLDLDRALNLDGGASTGVRLAEPEEGVAAFSLLPSVISVYPSS